MSGDLRVVCKVCGGSGLGSVSDRRRAAAIGRDESTYRSKWRSVYEWMLQQFVEAEQEACWALAATLNRAA